MKGVINLKHILIAQGATAPTAPSSKTIDLASSWNKVWGSVKSVSGFSSLDNVLLAVGGILILLSILQWLWKRRTGQPNHQHVAWTLLLGAFLMLPQVLIPVALTIVDVIVNAIASIAG